MPLLLCSHLARFSPPRLPPSNNNNNQGKCGDAKALDLIMNATATGCTSLSCAWAVDSIPLSVKLNLNVRRAGRGAQGLVIWG